MAKRAFIGILFRCCNVYGRAYINRDRSAYEARCPRCMVPITVKISRQGSKGRFFSIE